MSDSAYELLPPEAREFLRTHHRIEFHQGGGEVQSPLDLAPPETLHIDWLTSTAEETEFESEDPNCYGGVYRFRAVSLVRNVGKNSHHHDHVLYWFPDFSVFGQWDSEHWDAYYFPDAGWSDIVADPAPYLNGMWTLGRHVKLLRPWCSSHAVFQTYDQLRASARDEQPSVEATDTAAKAIRLQMSILDCLQEVAVILGRITDSKSRDEMVSCLQANATKIEDLRASLDDLIVQDEVDIILSRESNVDDAPILAVQYEAKRISMNGFCTPQLRQLLEVFVAF